MSDPDTLTELIDLFVADTADRLQDLRAAADRRDYASLRETAHTLKGSAGQMGAEQIAELCRDIERCAGRRESLDYPALVSLLDRYFQGVRQDMLAGRNCIA